MSSNTTGYMAMKITKENIEKISIVNGGVVPLMENVDTYFVFPYNFDAHCEILTAEVFHEKFRFMNNEIADQFVDCVKR